MMFDGKHYAMCPVCGSWLDHCTGHDDGYSEMIAERHDREDHTHCVKYRGVCVARQERITR
jgi:hypothetical protein